MSSQMNGSRFESDLDRVLGEWLAEGPRRAPESPMTAAIDWARVHPRRRDPFLALRSDPMGGRSLFAPLSQPAGILAVVGLLVISVFALGVGSDRSPVPTPPPVPATTPTPSPVVTPTPAPTPFDVELDVAAGSPATVTVLDRTGTLTGARTGVPDPNGASVAEGELQVTQVGETTIQLRWTGLPCRSLHDLTIDAGLAVTLDITPCDGPTDTFPLDRVLILEFASPVAAADVETQVTGSLLPAG